MKLFIILHIIISLHFIFEWFYGVQWPLIKQLRKLPKGHPAHEGIGLVMSSTEAEWIVRLRQEVPEDEHILWAAPTPVDPMLNYYLFPRRIYWQLTDAEEIRTRGIKWVVEQFDHGSVKVRRL